MPISKTNISGYQQATNWLFVANKRNETTKIDNLKMEQYFL